MQILEEAEHHLLLDIFVMEFREDQGFYNHTLHFWLQAYTTTSCITHTAQHYINHYTLHL